MACPPQTPFLNCSEVLSNVPVNMNCSTLLEDVSIDSTTIRLRYNGTYLPAKGKIRFTGKTCGSNQSGSTVSLNYGCRCTQSQTPPTRACGCDSCNIDTSKVEDIWYMCREDLGNGEYEFSQLIRGMGSCSDTVGNAALRREHKIGDEVLVGLNDCTWEYITQSCSGSALIQDCSDVTDCVNNCLLDPTTCLPNFCTAVNDCVVIPPTTDICAQMAAKPYGGIAVPGTTEILGVDCMRYTLPSSSGSQIVPFCGDGLIKLFPTWSMYSGAGAFYDAAHRVYFNSGDFGTITVPYAPPAGKKWLIQLTINGYWYNTNGPAPGPWVNTQAQYQFWFYFNSTVANQSGNFNALAHCGTMSTNPKGNHTASPVLINLVGGQQFESSFCRTTIHEINTTAPIPLSFYNGWIQNGTSISSPSGTPINIWQYIAFDGLFILVDI